MTVSQGQASFTVVGPTGATVVVPSATDLVTWTGVETNKLGSIPWTFVDPGMVDGEKRFYRGVLGGAVP